MINFPDAPTVNQSFTAAGITWVWDGLKWNVNTVAGSQYIIVSATAPTSPVIGSLWWDTVGGQLYVYYNDGNSSQWVTAINQGFGGLYLALTGGTLSGPLVLAADPVLPLGAATKEYVDAGGAAIPANYPLNSNRIINGDMRIDQRNNGTPALGIVGAPYTVDRWAYNSNVAGHLTWGRNGGGSGTPGPVGFPYCLGVANAATIYNPAVGDIFQFFQAIEADVVSDFVWGTINALPITLSFWVNSSIVGTFSGSLTNYAGTRSFPFSYSIPTAATWTKITITIPGDTAGTWVMYGNAGSLYLRFDLGCGATYRSAASGWQAGVFVGVTGTVQITPTASSNWYFTGVKLETGNIATPFNNKSLSEKLSDCQRYFQSFPSLLVGGYNVASGATYGSSFALPTTMRATPTAALGTFSYSNMSTAAAAYLDAYTFRLSAVTVATGAGWAQGPVTLAAEI